MSDAINGTELKAAQVDGLAGAIDRIEALTRRANRITLESGAQFCEPAGTIYIIDNETGVVRRTEARTPRNHFAFNIPDFVRLAKYMKQRVSAEPMDDGSPRGDVPVTIFHSARQVDAIADYGPRNDCVTLGLTFTSEFQLLCELGNKKLAHADMMRMLRTRLRGVFTQAEVDTLGAVTIDRKNKSDVHNAGHSLSAEAIARGHDAASIPKSMTARLHVYSQSTVPDCPMVYIDVMVEFLANELMFMLIPVTLDIDIAKEQSSAHVAKLLADNVGDAKIEIFHGQP